MLELLKSLLIHYFADSKRCTESVLTREMDRVIRSHSSDSPKLGKIVADARRHANVIKKQRSRQTGKFNFARSRLVNGSLVMPKFNTNPSVVHVPCGRKSAPKD